jgi:ArsR family transcriptional regulator
VGKRDKREFAAMFKALGDPTRLKIYQYLRVRCYPHTADTEEEHWIDNGPTVSEVAVNVTGSKKITSKVSQHLKELRISGLIKIERRGKNMICGVNHQAADQLVALLNCVESTEANEPEAAVISEESVEAVESPKSNRKHYVVVEAPVVDVELVKARRKSKAATNGKEAGVETA